MESAPRYSTNMSVLIFIASLTTLTLADNLTFVSILYRHGDRAPGFTYPTDPHPPTAWINGLGQLTNLGKKQSYELGKFIRNRYQDFLPTTYSAKDVRAFSPDVDRSLMSAYCVLTGLYEPVESDVWSESELIHWQPIPVHSIPVKLDNLMLNYYCPCPKLQQLLNETVFGPNSALLDKYREIISEIAKNAGFSMPSETQDILNIALNLHDILEIEEAHGMKLPNWTKDFYPESLTEMRIFIFSMRTYNVEMRRLRCGPLLKDIIEHMEEVVEGRSRIKMWQYCGHDTTVIEILQCLDVYDGDLVPLTSAVFFELHKDEKDFKVVVDYKKGEDIITLKIPNCETYCPFDLFIKTLMSDVLPTDWEKECEL